MTLNIADVLIFLLYLLIMLGIGIYFFRKNQTEEDYFVGGRNMGYGHIGLSVVATDVGGGFSIGLGGLGFTMGIAGSWMLFTGLLGAWISAVVLIPKVFHHARNHKFLSFPQWLGHSYGSKVAFVAALISLIGYIGFTSSQILAGAKLASASFPEVTLVEAILCMGVIAVLYTSLGGIKAVIYTDTVQWIILMAGLIFIGIPIGYLKLGGWENIRHHIQPGFLKLNNITWVQGVNWLVTILPIWFVGMTLYQRIYSCRDLKSAKKAWFLAGLFEWPVMAFMGVILGMFARVAFNMGFFKELGFNPGHLPDPETGLPMFLAHILPIGLMGLMMSAYFSAIMSTADSCLMAASGNMSADLFQLQKRKKNKFLNHLITLLIGAFAIILAMRMQNVLELMLYSYAFMVSGLFVPVLALLFLKSPSPLAAFISMIGGGGTTLIFILCSIRLPFDLNQNIAGLSLSAVIFITIQSIKNRTIGLHRTQ